MGGWIAAGRVFKVDARKSAARWKRDSQQQQQQKQRSRRASKGSLRRGNSGGSETYCSAIGEALTHAGVRTCCLARTRGRLHLPRPCPNTMKTVSEETRPFESLTHLTLIFSTRRSADKSPCPSKLSTKTPSAPTSGAPPPAPPAPPPAPPRSKPPAKWKPSEPISSSSSSSPKSSPPA